MNLRLREKRKSQGDSLELSIRHVSLLRPVKIKFLGQFIIPWLLEGHIVFKSGTNLTSYAHQILFQLSYMELVHDYVLFESRSH